MENRLQEVINRSFNIGPLEVDNRLLQAPMAGITGRAFRLQARRFGAGLVFTEMISSYGVHYGNRRTMDMLELTEAELPVAVQLFGNRPEIMAEAAVAAERAGAGVIDINMGCPVRKVIKTGAGVALMRDEGLAAEIVAAMAEAVRVPVIAKIRAGFSRVTAPSLALRLQEAGAAAVCIHPRTGAQGWRGRADHAVTAELARELDIPVIASGDIESRDDAVKLLAGGAAALMIGRAALGNPWVYSDLLSGNELRRRPLEEVIKEMRRFFEDAAQEMGEARAVRYMRKFYGWYLEPFAPSGELRAALRRSSGIEAAAALARRELTGW